MLVSAVYGFRWVAAIALSLVASSGGASVTTLSIPVPHPITMLLRAEPVRHELGLDREQETAVVPIVEEAGIEYAVAVDNESHNWNAWGNRVWPSVYLVDKRGFVRYWWYGELNWQGTQGESWMRGKIAELAAESGG